MAEATWEKGNRTNVVLQPNNRGRWKFLVGGLLILIAVGYLVATWYGRRSALLYHH